MKRLDKIKTYYKKGKKYYEGRLQDVGLDMEFIPDEGGFVVLNPNLKYLYIEEEK